MRGRYYIPNLVDGSLIPTPAYCHQCGTACSWTQSRLSAARELIREVEGLTDNEKGVLDRSLDDLVRDTPETLVAILRFKRLATKLGRGASQALKKILIEVMVESAKRQIWR